jgi:hypothetical protein
VEKFADNPGGWRIGGPKVDLEGKKRNGHLVRRADKDGRAEGQADAEELETEKYWCKLTGIEKLIARARRD